MDHISAGNTIATASKEKCDAWREEQTIKLNDGLFNMSTMFVRYCAVVSLVMISAGKKNTDLRLDKSPRQTRVFGCNPQ